MTKAIEFIQANWAAIAMISWVLVGILNAVTKHFGDYEGVKRVAMFILDLLSPIVSKDAPGLLKVPGLSVSPPKKAEG